MITLRRLVFAFLVVAVVCGAHVVGQDKQVSRVLFIGNSYTYVNNLPEMFAQLAKAGGHQVQVGMLAPGGWKLQDHWERAEDHATLRDGRWDVVVLQEQSTLGVNAVVDGKPRVTSDRVFRPYADKWAAEIASRGARVLFYLTWARKASPEDQSILTDAYRRAAQANHAAVAPIGIAWRDVRQANPSIELFMNDGSHPSPAGTYLAACTFYAAIFNANPAGLPTKVTGTPVSFETGLPENGKTAVLVELNRNDAAVLQAAAWRSWQASK